MPLTVAAVESDVVTNLRGKLVALGMSTVTDGTNDDLMSSIRKSLNYVGRTVADPTTVTDSDLSPVSGWDAEKLFDAATLETLYVCLGQCSDVDETVGTNQQRWSQLAAQITSQIKELEEKLLKPYGPNMPRGAVGTMHAGHPMPNDPFNPWRSRVPPAFWPYPYPR